MKRRNFLRNAGLGLLGLATGATFLKKKEPYPNIRFSQKSAHVDLTGGRVVKVFAGHTHDWTGNGDYVGIVHPQAAADLLEIPRGHYKTTVHMNQFVESALQDMSKDIAKKMDEHIRAQLLA